MAIGSNECVQVVATMQDVVGSQIQNVHYWLHAGTSSVTEANFLVTLELEMTSMYSNMAQWMPDTLVPVSLKADIVEYYGGEKHIVRAVGEIPWVSWGGGTGTTDGLPQGAAAIANFDTPNIGAYARNFMGPLTEAAQADGELLSTPLAALAAYAAAKITGMSVTAEFFSAAVMSTKYGAPLALTAAIAKSIIGYQRRRRAGRGA